MCVCLSELLLKVPDSLSAFMAYTYLTFMVCLYMPVHVYKKCMCICKYIMYVFSIIICVQFSIIICVHVYVIGEWLLTLHVHCTSILSSFL